MGDIKLFNIDGPNIAELHSKSLDLEKSLQTLLEKNLETFLGVKFLSSEYSTGKVHGGRIDTLGLDENNCPVIIEYKRAVNENVMNQGLFYLDWLLDHKADFKMLVLDLLGKEQAEKIDWNGPRLICIASAFTKYDEHAVRQINRNIDLVRYRYFEQHFITLELVYSNSATTPSIIETGKTPKGDKPVSYWLEHADPNILDLFKSLQHFVTALGDDVVEKQLKLYIAYRRIKNLACVVIQKKTILIILRLNPETVNLEKGFSRDVRNIGHWGTGDLEVLLRDSNDLRKAQPLIVRSYEES